MTDSKEPLYYLKGDTIWKRPRVVKQEAGKKTITVGFPVCKCSQYIKPESLLQILNETEQP